MRSTVRFFLNGDQHEVDYCSPSATLLDYLRVDCRLTGSKEGCAEGDCGACTVIVAEASPQGPAYLAMNSCILPLAAVDGKALVSVDGLAPGKDSLHPVQAAMVETHGSQCGFCTPGFVMSLAAMYHDRQLKDYSRGELNLNLAGNLCRCTGYAPIVRAAETSMQSRDEDCLKRLDERISAELAALDEAEPLHINGPQGSVFVPRTLEQLLALRKDHPQATLVAGATDVGLWITKGLQRFDAVIHTGAVAELKEITREHGQLSIGAAVRYREALPELVRAYPAMRGMLERLGGMQVRNAGTVGGNIANGSPIGDMPPALIALGATLELRSAGNVRQIPLEEFFIEYGRQDLRDDEIVSRILLPLHDQGWFACYKVSKRIEQDISALCAGIYVQVEQGEVQQARVCLGGMAGTPCRATGCENALSGRPWQRSTVESAMKALEQDYEPISDMRASAAYRMAAAKNLLLRFYFEHAPDTERLEQADAG